MASMLAGADQLGTPLMRRVLGVVALSLAVSYVWLIPGHTYDFAFDWFVVNSFSDGIDPYQPMSTLAGHYGLVNELDTLHPRTPGALIVLLPIGLIPESVFYEAGRLLTIGGAILLGWVVAKVGRWDPLWSLAALPVVLMVWPFSEVVAMSQLAFLVAALIGLTLLLVQRRADWWAGVPLGLAVTLKLWPWLLVVALLAARKWRPAVAAGATFAGLNMIGLTFPHVTASGAIEAMTSTWTVHGPRSASFAGLLGLPIMLLPLIAAVGVLLLRRLDWKRLYSNAIPIALVAAPVLWETYLVALVVPVAFFCSRGRLPDPAAAETTRPPRRRKGPARGPFSID